MNVRHLKEWRKLKPFVEDTFDVEDMEDILCEFHGRELDEFREAYKGLLKKKNQL